MRALERRYVAHQAAEENPMHLPSTQKFLGVKSIGGAEIVRDQGHAGWTLRTFCDTQEAQQAKLTEAEVCALRLCMNQLSLTSNATAAPFVVPVTIRTRVVRSCCVCRYGPGLRSLERRVAGAEDWRLGNDDRVLLFWNPQIVLPVQAHARLPWRPREHDAAAVALL